MYTVIGAAASRTFRVLWMLEELGQPYEHVPVPPRDQKVTAHSPSGKIPVLLVDGSAIADSAAILTYLADKHGALTAAPGTLARAQQDSLTFCILDELEALIWTAARHTFVLPEAERVPQIKDSLKEEYARNLTRLTQRIQGPFAMGDQMTVPDILLTHCCNWAEIAKFPEPDSALVDYLDRMRGREAFQRAWARRTP